MNPSAYPLVTIAIPLFRSAPFVENIIANLTATQYPNLEILISDRHMADDALTMLKDRLGAQPHIRFIEARDEMDWIAHHNFLLSEARGEYFTWMPHDDQFPEHFIARLVERLETNPEAILAFGRILAIDLNDSLITDFAFSDPSFEEDEPWSLTLMLRLLTSWSLGVPFRGVVRRKPVVDAKIFLQPTYETVNADLYWVFGVGLLGRLSFVPECHMWKRYHANNTHTAWRQKFRHARSGFLTLRMYTRLAGCRFSARALAYSVFVLWLGARQISDRATALPSGLRFAAERFIHWVFLKGPMSGNAT